MMQRLSVILIVSAIAVLLTLTGCTDNTESKTTFVVEGMTCESCSSAITETLLASESVTTAWADHERGVAEAVHRPATVSAEELKAKIENLGYTVAGVSSKPIS